jgi:hypothetical protein
MIEHVERYADGRRSYGPPFAGPNASVGNVG